MSRFSTMSEIKQTLSQIDLNLHGCKFDNHSFSGPVLLYNKLPFKETYIDDSESHVAIVGSTGYGKSRRAFSTSVLTALKKKGKHNDP